MGELWLGVYCTNNECANYLEHPRTKIQQCILPAARFMRWSPDMKPWIMACLDFAPKDVPKDKPQR